MREKALKDITYADVVAFCKEERPESSSLDYKAQYPSAGKIATLVSAMANVHGGWILIGVPEKKPNKGAGIPDAPTGAEANIASAIQNSCLDAIYPPVLPEFRPIPIPESDLEVLVIRVYESDSTPHEIDGKIYVRTNDVNFQAEDGRSAKVGEIEMLLNRREKAVQLKSRLISRAEERHRGDDRPPRLTMSSIPTYPNDVIATYKQLVDVKLALSDLPIFRQSRTYATANESIYSETTNIGKAAQFEFGIHGLFHYSTNFYEERSGQVELRYSLAETHSIFMICQLLKVAEYFYEAIDYQGLVDLRVGLRSRPESTRLGHSNISIVDGQFFVGVRRLAHAINSVETASTLCKDFLWSAGAGPSAQVTDTFDKEITSAFNECAKTVLY